MLIYVDDIIVTGTHFNVISAQIFHLQQEFPLKDLGFLSFFLGIQVTRTSQELHLSQSKYIADLLSRVHMDGAKPAKSPCGSGVKFSQFDGEQLSDPSLYRHVVGALQYFTLTRREIAFSVNQLCQHLHTPTSTHWAYAKWVLRYLKGVVEDGLFYTKGSLQLQAYCDSDWAGSPDDRRSTSGFAVYLGQSRSCLLECQETINRVSIKY